MKTHEQKISGQVREQLAVDHAAGMATLRKLDAEGRTIATETFSSGDGRVTQFIRNAEPRR